MSVRADFTLFVSWQYAHFANALPTATSSGAPHLLHSTITRAE